MHVVTSIKQLCHILDKWVVVIIVIIIIVINLIVVVTFRFKDLFVILLPVSDLPKYLTCINKGT